MVLLYGVYNEAMNVSMNCNIVCISSWPRGHQIINDDV
jgi:hypothetical protein